MCLFVCSHQHTHFKSKCWKINVENDAANRKFTVPHLISIDKWHIDTFHTRDGRKNGGWDERIPYHIDGNIHFGCNQLHRKWSMDETRRTRKCKKHNQHLFNFSLWKLPVSVKCFDTRTYPFVMNNRNVRKRKTYHISGMFSKKVLVISLKIKAEKSLQQLKRRERKRARRLFKHPKYPLGMALNQYVVTIPIHTHTHQYI